MPTLDEHLDKLTTRYPVLFSQATKAADWMRAFGFLLRFHASLLPVNPKCAQALRAALGPEIREQDWIGFAEEANNPELQARLNALLRNWDMDETTQRRQRISRGARADDAAKRLDEIVDALFIYNPTPYNSKGLMKYAFPGGQYRPTPVGEYQIVLRTPQAYGTMRTKQRKKFDKSSLPADRAWQGGRRFLWNSRKHDLIQIKSRRGLVGGLPSLNNEGQEYWQTSICNTAGHHMDPLYEFHAIAWAKRRYAVMLEQYGFNQCPVMGDIYGEHMTVEGLLEYNDESLSNFCRWMVEAQRFADRVGTNAGNKNRPARMLCCYWPLTPDAKGPRVLVAPPGQQLPTRVIRQMLTPDAQARASALQATATQPEAVATTFAELQEYIDAAMAEHNITHLPRLTLHTARTDLKKLWGPDDDDRSRSSVYMEDHPSTADFIAQLDEATADPEPAEPAEDQSDISAASEPEGEDDEDDEYEVPAEDQSDIFAVPEPEGENYEDDEDDEYEVPPPDLAAPPSDLAARLARLRRNAAPPGQRVVNPD